MKDITINGVLYLPATVLAKEFRYTTDYIGQLCRSKKVDAQLVGRSWYVNPLSLKSHKNNKTKKVLSGDVSINKATDFEVSVSDLDSVDDENVRKIQITNEKVVKNLPSANNNFVKRLSWKPAKYEDDADELIPSVAKSSFTPQRISINLADSTDIPIKSGSESTKLVADELPSVSLKGELKVTNIDDYFDDIVADIKSVEEEIVEDLQAGSDEVLFDNYDHEDKSVHKITPNLHKKHIPKRPVSLIPKRELRKQEIAVVYTTNKAGSDSLFGRIIFISSVTALLVITAMSFFVESTLLASSTSLENKIKISKPSALVIEAYLSNFSY